MKAAFYTLGCKVNQYETESMREQLRAHGYEIVGSEHQPDVFVLNSCTVTAESDRKTRQMLRRFRELLPHAVIVLAGCMPQAFPEKAAELTAADVIIGNAAGTDIISSVNRFFQTGETVREIYAHEKNEEYETKPPIARFENHTRTFLKIQDGCDRLCSYCIIPTARGRVRSKPLDQIRSEAELMTEAGYKEIVLVGINLSSYGKSTDYNLADAVMAVCDIPGISRVRLGSIEPDQMTADIITKLAAQPKLCPHFHLSLQSGCDKTLKAMNRHYDTGFYRELVTKLRSAFPDCSVTTDIMVGFPGETDLDFEESRRFLDEIGFADAHVFSYSKRDGTPAADMPHQIPRSVRTERSRLMSETAELCRLEFIKARLGGVYEVLFEKMTDSSTAEGYTGNYIKVRVEADASICGKIVKTRLLESKDGYCQGVIVDQL